MVLSPNLIFYWAIQFKQPGVINSISIIRLASYAVNTLDDSIRFFAFEFHLDKLNDCENEHADDAIDESTIDDAIGKKLNFHQKKCILKDSPERPQ